ncbi:MAG: hypothetical protein ACJ741_05935 [Pyrinomonadaceae bacterium]
MTPNLILAQAEMPQIHSTTILVTIVALLIAGAVGWLVATVLGFMRGGAAARWFAVSALCLLAYHVQWLAFALVGMKEQDMGRLLGFGAYFNLFVVVGSICAIAGFLKLPRASR